MELEVWRLNSQDDSTIGALMRSGDGKRRWLCWTLEDEFRTKKKFSETRIPAGRYKLALRTVGGHHRRYKFKFPTIHRGMLWVLDVPGFEFILIHIGNDDDDTAGCLLVGDVARSSLIEESTAAYERIYPEIANAIHAGEEVFINYMDVDTPPIQ